MNQETIHKTTKQLLLELMPDNKKLTRPEIQAILPRDVETTTLLRVIRILRREGKLKKTVNLKKLGQPHYAKIP